MGQFATSFGIMLQNPDGTGAVFASPTEAILKRPDGTEIKDYEATASFLVSQEWAGGGTLPSRWDASATPAMFPQRANLLRHALHAMSHPTAGDLETGTRREWLETNGLGSFAMGTVAGPSTRRYHAILCAATRPPVARMVLVNRLEEVAVVDGGALLAVDQLLPGHGAPRGLSQHPRLPARSVADLDAARRRRGDRALAVHAARRGR